MNDTHVTITGWVGADVGLTQLAGGQQVASFRVGSTPRRWREGEWHDGPTMWVQVKAWRRLAAHVAQSVRTGDPVIVRGRLVADVWEKEDGSVVSQTVLVATSVGHDLARGTSVFTKAARTQDDPVRDASQATESVAPAAAPAAPAGQDRPAA